jgi:hypothetical protein
MEKSSKIPAKEEIFFLGSTAPIWALAYLHETLLFTSVYRILDVL